MSRAFQEEWTEYPGKTLGTHRLKGPEEGVLASEWYKRLEG